jgi:flagellar basal-body rod modification protein FlgD
VEQMQNMAASIELQRAASLVGETVFVETTSANGNTTMKEGKVDYVHYENGKAYLVIEEALYPLDSLVHVVNREYLEAVELATAFVSDLNRLPGVNVIDLNDGEKIDKLGETYRTMTAYQKTFVASEKVTALEGYIEKLKTVRAAAEESTARKMAAAFVKDMDALPDVDDLALSDEEAVRKLEATYRNMTDYQKSFVGSDYVKLLEEYTVKLQGL